MSKRSIGRIALCRRTRLIVWGIACLLGLQGCMSLPVKGRFQDGSEAFYGNATGYALILYPAFGPISIYSNKGADCQGRFTYHWGFDHSGEGWFRCKDERVGDFFFYGNGTEGEGFGRDNNGRLFEFKFGGPEYTARAEAQAAQWQAWSQAFDRMAQQYRPSTTYCAQYANSFRCTHYNY